jgi:hypothetical protein
MSTVTNVTGVISLNESSLQEAAEYNTVGILLI